MNKKTIENINVLYILYKNRNDIIGKGEQFIYDTYFKEKYSQCRFHDILLILVNKQYIRYKKVYLDGFYDIYIDKEGIKNKIKKKFGFIKNIKKEVIIPIIVSIITSLVLKKLNLT